MSAIAYRCKMCGRQGQAQMECSEEQLKEMGFNLEVWRSMLTCNRCYDFRESYRALADWINRCCRAFELMTKTKRKETEEKMREKLETHTKRLVSLLAEHFNQPNIWDAAIVDGLIEQPENCGPQVAHVYHTVRKGLHAAGAQTRLPYAEETTTTQTER